MNHSAHAQYEMDPEVLRRVLPDRPGVYLFKDLAGRVVYVGKAKNLKKRVLSYFRSNADLVQKTALMMKKARGLARLCGWLMAVELRAVDIDFSFAPVLMVLWH